ncbi:hypothetical protein HDZ31DRAFT_31140 [Schizophyllum fasciatum]
MNILKQNLELTRIRYLRSAEEKTRACSVAEFYANYAEDWQRLSEVDATRVVRRLKRTGDLSDIEWTALPIPRKTNENGSRWYKTEDAHFKGLETVFKTVVLAAEEELPKLFSAKARTTTMMCRPRQTMASEIEGSSHMVDAIAVRNGSSYPMSAKSGAALNGSVRLRCTKRTVFTADALVTGEFKMEWSKKACHDNDKKSIGHAGHAFYNDVARVAVYSFTIEGTQMRLWCHTRSHTGTTFQFDINKNPEEFIQFILFTTYATPAQLGIDPTVRRVIDADGFLQYQFDVYDAAEGTTTIYETESLIEETSALEIYSRAMRVFAVRQVIHQSKSAKRRRLATGFRVLRDYWVYSDVEAESFTQRAIRRSLKAAGIWDNAMKHFMHVLQDGVVTLPPPLHDTRRSFPLPSSPLCGKVPSPHVKALPYSFTDAANPEGAGPSTSKISEASKLRPQGYASAGHTPAPHSPTPKLLQLHAKKHMRTVYEQLCRDLYRISDPAFFFYALSEVIKILRYFKLAGYLHRDVSPGNFLLYYLKGEGLLPSLEDMAKTRREDWVTIVSDLEYSRAYYGGKGHDPLTGTSYYVAVELQCCAYLFKPRDRRKPFSAALKTFSYNFYHDVESAIWMALDFAIRHAPQTIIDSVLADGRSAKEVLQDYAQKLFVPEIQGNQIRHGYVTDPTYTGQLADDLREIYGGSAVSRVGDLVFDLYDAYVKLEDSLATPPVVLANGRKELDPALFEDSLYDTLEAAFLEISDYYALPENAVTFVPVPERPPPPFADLFAKAEEEADEEPAVEPDEVLEGSDAELDARYNAQAAATAGQDDEDAVNAEENEDAEAAHGAAQDGTSEEDASDGAEDEQSGTRDAPGADVDMQAAQPQGLMTSKRKHDADTLSDLPVQAPKRSRNQGALAGGSARPERARPPPPQETKDRKARTK